VPHARAARFPAAVLIVASRGRGAYRALLALLVTTSGAILGAVSGIIERCLLIATWGHLPAHLCGAVCGHLVAGGMPGGDAVWILECAPKEVALSALPRALLVATRQCAWAA
jgi:hypothetical protein